MKAPKAKPGMTKKKDGTVLLNAKGPNARALACGVASAMLKRARVVDPAAQNAAVAWGLPLDPTPAELAQMGRYCGAHEMRFHVTERVVEARFPNIN